MNWTIDLGHSSILFSVRHLVIARVRGKFGSFSGTMELDDADLTKSRVAIEIDASSIDTGQAQRDAHLRTPDFFAVEEFPKATFASTEITKSGDGYDVTGDFTLHGVTRPLTLRGRFLGTASDPRGNPRAVFEATATVDREDFGLKWNQLLAAGGVAIGTNVELEIAIQALRAS